MQHWNFFMNNMCGTSYYPAAMTYDMCSGSLMGSMNLQWNQGIDHMRAMQGLYMVPQYNFNNFTQYTGFQTSNNYLLDPMYTMGMMDWQNRLQYGTGLFGNNGLFQFQPSTGVWGWQPSGTTSSSSSSTSSAEDAPFVTKNNKLATFLKYLRDSENILSDTERDEVKYALQNYSKEKGAKAQYEYLKKCYDEKIDKANLKENIGKLKIGKDLIEKDLIKIGFEGTNDDVDNHLSSLRNAIAGAGDNGNLESEHLVGHVAAGGADILDVLSSWNSEYRKNSSSTESFIQFVKKHANNDNQEALINSTVKPFVEKLSQKAKSVINEKIDNKYVLDNDTRSKIEKAYKDLDAKMEKVLKDKKASGLTNLNKDFENLYVMLRLATAKIETKKVQKEYEFLGDDEVFADNMFIDDTEDDLKKEGFTNLNNYTINTNNGSTSTQNTEDTEEATGATGTTGSTTTTSSTSTATTDETTATKEQARANGNWVRQAIAGYTEEFDYVTVNKYISSEYLNKDNVVEFLDGYYNNGKRGKIEGIIEHLDDEYDKGEIEFDNKVNIVTSLIERAKEAGVSENYYEKLELIINNTDKYAEKETFNKGGAGNWWKSILGFMAGGIFWGKYTYNEVIDKEMKTLAEQIKAKEAQTTQTQA